MAKRKKADKVTFTERNGYLSKRIRGETKYFGTRHSYDYDEALKDYEAYMHKLYCLDNGLPLPGEKSGSPVVADLLDAFMEDDDARLKAGDIIERTFREHKAICEIIAKILKPNTPLDQIEGPDFTRLRTRLLRGKKQKTRSPKSQDRDIGYARRVFNFGLKRKKFRKWIDPDELDALAKIKPATIKKHKDEQPLRLLTRAELRKAIDKAKPKLKAMILLAINGGFNNSDIINFPLEKAKTAIDGGLISWRREKEPNSRIVPLWPETIKALEVALSIRAPSRAKNFFLTAEESLPYTDTDENNCEISKMFGRLLTTHKIRKKGQQGKNFGALRSTFATSASELIDEIAAKAIMGHKEASQFYTAYVHGVHFPRLEAITNHVREWLFGDGKDTIAEAIEKDIRA